MRKTRCALAVGLALITGVAYAVVPEVSTDVKKATETIYKDPVMQKMLNSALTLTWKWLALHRRLAQKCVAQKSSHAVWLKNGDLIKKTL